MDDGVADDECVVAGGTQHVVAPGLLEQLPHHAARDGQRLQPAIEAVLQQFPWIPGRRLVEKQRDLLLIGCIRLEVVRHQHLEERVPKAVVAARGREGLLEEPVHQVALCAPQA